MSTITGLYANAITPVAPRPHNDAEHNQNAPRDQFAQTSFIPVDANQKNDASASTSDQRPSQDGSRENQQNVQNEHNQSQTKNNTADNPSNEKTDEQTNSKEQQASKERTALQQEQQIISQLKTRDAEVRTHEMAHKSVGGKYAGGIQYEYTKGPDGMNYAVGGEVSISISALSDPEMTVKKMQQVRQAALAPAEPSNQDRAVAQMATQIEMKAYADIAKMERAEENAKAQEKAEAKEEYAKDNTSSANDTKTNDDSSKSDNQSRSSEIGVEDFEVPETVRSAIDPASEYTKASGLNLNVIA